MQGNKMARGMTLTMLLCAAMSLAACSMADITGSVFDTASSQTGITSGQTTTQGGQATLQNEQQTAQGEQATTQETETIGSSEITPLDFPEVDSVSLSGSGTVYTGTADVTITQSGIYTFSGTFSNKTITVNVDKDTDDGVVYLVLDGVSMVSENGTPINIIEAKDVVIVLADGSVNTIYQEAVTTTDEDFPSGAIYTKADTLITGSGTLNITTLYNDGINARDDLIIDGATITIDAVGDGIAAKDLLAIRDASITITSGEDGIKTTNDEDADKGNLIIASGTFTINAAQDGISAERTLQIDDGSFTIASGGGYVEVLKGITLGEGSSTSTSMGSMTMGRSTTTTQITETDDTPSMKAIKATDILINGGSMELSAYDDAINADNTIIINGGSITILTGDDGVTANNTLTINDGDITVTYGYEGLEASYLNIHGGNISVTVLDDAVNGGSADGMVTITGGSIFLSSQGDCIDCNGDLTVTGGEIVFDSNAIYTGGDGAMDVTGTSTITGGTLVDVDGNEVGLLTEGGSSGFFSMMPGQSSTQGQMGNNTQRR